MIYCTDGGSVCCSRGNDAIIKAIIVMTADGRIKTTF